MAASCHYPEAPKSAQTDTYHGVEVQDPFRPLEEKSEARSTWIDAQNKLTNSYLDGVAAKSAIEEIARRLWPYRTLTLPTNRGNRWFAASGDGVTKQSKVVAANRFSPKARWRTVIDPNGWSNSTTIGVTKSIPSPDGKLMLYAYSWGGQDGVEWSLCEVDSGAVRPDRFAASRSPVWAADSQGFYYTHYTFTKTVNDGVVKEEWLPRIWYHTVGTSNQNDRLVSSVADGLWGPLQTVADKYLVFLDSESSGSKAPGTIQSVGTDQNNARPAYHFGAREAVYELVGEIGTTCYVLTDLDAPRFRVIAFDMSEGEAATVREVIPETELVLNTCVMVKDRFVAEYLDGQASRLFILDQAGRSKREVALPGPGSVIELKAEGKSNSALYLFDSTALPGVLVRVNVRTGKQKTIFEKRPKGFDSSQYVTESRFATSKDGTRVPYVIVYKKGIAWDGNNPTYMYGYGGFGVPVRPRFDKKLAVWLEMGGVYVAVATRGGGEFGQEWHEAGTKLHKQNVFDDFIAAGESLVESQVTSPAKLAIGGGSNGGLLVAACYLQRPDLFAAALCMAGVHDMLRYNAIGKFKSWEPDYGCIEDADEFQAMLAYSPVHNVAPGTAYPAMLIVTGANDDRVVPMNSYKLLAALQAAQTSDKPILGYIEMQSGHGIGTDTVDMQIRQCVTFWSFLASVLGMTVQHPREGSKDAD